MAVSVFTPNCTLPPPGTNLVTAPRVRSTFEIMWSCASIIILCTWSVLHLNVPPMRPAAGYWRSLWWAIVDCFKTEFTWMVITILAPEVTLSFAANSLEAAHGWGIRSWKTHSRPIRTHLANMGYFVLDWGFDPEAHENDELLGEAERRVRFCHDQLYTQIRECMVRSAANIGTQEPIDFRINAKRLQGRYWTLNAPQWSYVEEWGLAKLPDVPEHHLEKLGSSGALLKCLALLQIAWLVLQLISRKVQGLPSSQLEVATLAFAAESFATYLCYWTKPQGVQTRCFVKILPEVDSLAATWAIDDCKLFVKNLINAGPDYIFTDLDEVVTSGDFEDPFFMPNKVMHADVVGLSFPRTINIQSSSVLALVFGGVIFGSFHCLAWNFAFPTVVESILWRACAVAVMVLPGMAITASSLAAGGSAFLGAIFRALCFGCMIVYVIARLVLIVEMFRSLFYAVPGVFEDTWSSEVPHVG